MGDEFFEISLLNSLYVFVFPKTCRIIKLLIRCNDILFKKPLNQRVRNMEDRYNWRGSPYHMIIHALQTVFHLNKKYLSDVQLLRIQLFWIFDIQMKYCLQSMYNRMVGRTASVISFFYSLLPVCYTRSLNLIYIITWATRKFCTRWKG